MRAVLSIFGIVASFLAVGGFLDLIIRRDIKAKMFSDRPSSEAAGGKRLAFVSKLVLIENFSGLARIPFIVRISAYSIFFLLIVVFFQITVYRSNYLDWFPPKISPLALGLALALLISGVIFVDVVSFFETRILLSLYSKATRLVEILLLGMSEFLLTINIFIIGFSFFFALALAIIEHRSEEGEFVAGVEISKSGIDTAQLEDSLLNNSFPAKAGRYFDSKYARAKLSLWPTDDGRASWVTAAAYAYSDIDLSIASLAAMLSNLRSDVGQFEQVAEAQGISQLFAEGEEIPLDYNIVGKYRIDTYPIFGYLWQRYSAAYEVTDLVQTEFPYSMSLSPGWNSNTQIIRSTESLILDSKEATGPDTFCLGTGVKISPIKFANIDKCLHWIVLDHLLLDDLMYSKTFWELGYGETPVFTFFYSSLTLTVILYVAYFLSFLLRYSGQNDGGGGNLLRKYVLIEAAPFSFVLFVLGLVISVVYVASGALAV